MAVSQPNIAFFCMPEPGHFQSLRAVIARFAARGITPSVFTHHDFGDQIEQLGGRFIDLFAKYPIDAADDRSQPIPCRYVSFAGHYAVRVIDDLGSLDPSLIVYDAFAPIGLVAARSLGIPYVSVNTGHNVNPARYLSILSNDRRVNISPECRSAVDQLRGRFALKDASPFSYVDSLSPFLNLYCEPPEFLDEPDRAAFEPVAFFGSLPDAAASPATSPDPWSSFDPHPRGTLNVYISFGTVIWRYFAAEAAAALQAIARACAGIDHVRAIISLAGVEVDQSLAASLQSRNVQVLPRVDQMEVLKQADLFITHHGVNSTHEAIFNRVPMISCPFFWDQPALAAKCQRLGLGIPLTGAPGAPIAIDDVKAAISAFEAARQSFATRLTQARQWEIQTMNQRDAVIQRMLDLIPA